MNKSQRLIVVRIKEYLIKHHTSKNLELEEFAVSEDVHDRVVPRMKPSVWVKIKATIDVPIEIRKNPYLKETWYFLIGDRGRIRHANRYGLSVPEKDYAEYLTKILR